MPTPKVVATLPFPAGAASGSKSSARARHSGAGPATLSFCQAYAQRRALEPVGDAYRELLEEATDLARSLGCDVRSRPLGGAGGGSRWVGGRLRVVLDVHTTPRRRLSVLADALRGEHRLASYEMSNELAAYLRPTRAA